VNFVLTKLAITTLWMLEMSNTNVVCYFTYFKCVLVHTRSSVFESTSETGLLCSVFFMV